MLCAFWLQNVLRATTPCTFNILTSKNAPELRCFAHFHFEMCFAPQCLALFQHMNFQKGVGREVLLAFWLPNALRATAARNFSYLISPHGSARRFTKPTFRPSGATKHRKNTACRSFSTFSRASSSFYWLSLSLSPLTSSFLTLSAFLRLLSPLLLHLSILLEVRLLNFLR